MSSSFLRCAFTVPPSTPDMPTAGNPPRSMAETMDLFIFPAITIVKISKVSSSVYRLLNPLGDTVNRGSLPILSDTSLTSLPPPCIRTTRCPWLFKFFRSSMKDSGTFSSRIDPPSFITISKYHRLHTGCSPEVLSPSVSSNRDIIFIHCTPCPAPPLTKLSRAEKITSLDIRLSTSNPMSQ